MLPLPGGMCTFISLIEDNCIRRMPRTVPLLGVHILQQNATTCWLFHYNIMRRLHLFSSPLTCGPSRFLEAYYSGVTRLGDNVCLGPLRL
jgi:hypothetical protein